MNLFRIDRRTILLLAMIFGTLVCHSQGTYHEQVFVHLDRNYFLAGEQIRFAIYCTEKGTGKPSRASEMANIELLNQEGTVIRKGKIKLADGVGSGCFDIPSQAHSEEYMIRCYTSWMRNFGPGSYSYNSVLIIHPSKPYMPVENRIMRNGQEVEDTAGHNLQIKATGLKENYASRDTIKFFLEAQSPSGSATRSRLSVSITRSGCFNLETPFTSSGIIQTSGLDDVLAEESVTMKYLPDMEGLQLTGLVQQRITGQPFAKGLVILSFIDSVSEIQSVKTNAEGRFRFDLNGLTGEKDLIIQTLGRNGDLLITIDPDFSQEPVPESAKGLLDQEDLEEIFSEMLLNQQLTTAYESSGFHTPAPIPDTPAASQRLPFYGMHDHKIVMKEFIKLPVMEEVFRELGKRVYLERQQGEYKVTILDLKTNRIIGDRPYYFLDGVPFFDSGKLLDLDPSKIESISLKSQKYFVGDLAMDGIIDIRSHKGDASLIDFPISAVRQYFHAFSKDKPKPPASSRNDPRVPLFQTTLYFNPSVETDPDKEGIVELIAPDAKGSYDLVIRGVDNKGRIADQHFSFIVE